MVDTTQASQVNPRRFPALRYGLSKYRQLVALLAAVLLLWTVLSFASPYFMTVQNLTNIALQSSVVGIMAVGFTILLIGGEIDLAIGSTQALAGTLAALLIIQRGLSIWAGVLIVLAMGLIVGNLNGYFSLFTKIPSFIVTLAMLGVLQGLAFVMTSGQTIGGFPEAYKVLGHGRIGVIPLPVIIFFSVTVLVQLVLSQTRYGVELYATGGNREAASLVGISVRRVLMLAFIASSILCTLAGLVLSARLNAGHGSFGSESLLDAVAAVIIGGTSLNGGAGNTFGTLLGIILISTIKNGLILLGVDPFWQQVAVGALILAAVLVDKMIKGEMDLRELLPRLGRR